MANLNATIKDIVSGDDYTYTVTVTNVPAGDSLAKAWLTVKTDPALPDASATFQKPITTTNVAGTGQITDTGAGDTIGTLRFDFVPADTSLLLPDGTIYYYDIQVKTTAGKVYTIEIGRITTKQGVTVTTT